MTGTDRLTIEGQPLLVRRIREAARRDTISHAVILSGQGDLAGAARFTAAALECEGGGPPCGVCGPCRKVMRDVHPDVITVTDPEHKNISTEVLRRTAADAYVLPNQGRRKVYIFPDCGLLEPKAQNVLLKVLEEGPAHAAFLFCARSSAVLLPTIRSRAVEWKLSAGEAEPEAGDGPRRLCQLLCGGAAADIAAFCVELENSKPDRERLRQLLSGARDLLTAGLAASYGVESGAFARRLAAEIGPRRLSAYAEVLGELSIQCQYNIGAGHLAGALAAALTE